MGMGSERSLAHQHGCRNMNSLNFCTCWSIELKLAEIFQNEFIYIVLKFFFSQKIGNSNF